MSNYKSAIKSQVVIADTECQRPSIVDINKLFENGNIEELALVIVSIDAYGKIISKLMDLMWDLWPYEVKLGDRRKTVFDFRFLANSASLLLEFQIIMYVWLKVKNNKNKKKRIKVSSLYRRFEKMKLVFMFLVDNNCDGVYSLSEYDTWYKFVAYVKERCRNRKYLEHWVSVLKNLLYIKDNLPFNVGFDFNNINLLEAELKDSVNVDECQTFAMPGRITDLIYGEALALVEFAWPNRQAISELLQKLSELNGLSKVEVDKIIDSDEPPKHKKSQNIWQIDRSVYSRAYRDAIMHRNKTQRKSIISKLLPLIVCDKLIKPKNWFQAHLNRLLSACYICANGFSGMRPSEGYQLTPGCYAARTVNNQVFHVLLSATHKNVDGLRPDEWLCSPCGGKAVELAEALTSHHRSRLKYLSEQNRVAGEKGLADFQSRAADCLWVHSANFIKEPEADIGCMRSSLVRFVEGIGAVVTESDLIEFQRLNRKVPQSMMPVVGQVWPFHPQQMRRTFAVFGGRYKLTGSVAIKQQFKHLKLRISEYYGSGSTEARAVDVRLDQELMQLIYETDIDYQASVLHHLYNSNDPITGGKGKIIIEERSNSSYQYGSYDVVRQLVKQNLLTYHSTGVAGCANGYNCDMDGVVNPAYCVECDGAIITIEHGPSWQHKHAIAVERLKNDTGVSDNEYSHYFTIILAAERVMTDLNIAFLPFDSAVGALRYE